MPPDSDQKIAVPLSAAPAPGAAPVDRAGPREWWMVVMLTIAAVASVTDRNGISLLVAPLKAQFDLSDIQISLVLGFAFIAPYSLFALPAGYLVDLVSRRVLLACAITIWSTMSSFCGFAGNFVQLFIGRTGIGLAEAALIPSANSLIRDGFPRESRSRAFSIFTIGSVLGTGVGFYVVGGLISLGDSGFFRNWPVLGHMQTWQLVLAVPGLCTLPLALLMLTVPEPARRSSPILRSDTPSWGNAVHYVRTHSWVYVPLLAAAACNSWAREGFNSWEPTALIRGWGLKAGQIAHINGELQLALGAAGVFAAAFLIEWWHRRGAADAPIRVMCIGQLASLACNVGMLHVPLNHTSIIFVLMGIRIFFSGPNTIGMALTISSITPGRLMGRLSAVLFLCSSLLATTGSTVVALISHYCFAGDLAIIPAIQTFYIPAQLLATGLYIVAALAVQRFYRIHEDGAG